MKKLLLICLLFCAVPFTAAFAAPAKPHAEAQWLFVIHADEGALKKTDNGQLQLTLKPVDMVNYFSDRPVRKSGAMTAGDFMQNWTQGGKDSFASDNPNASLVAILDRKDKKSSEDTFLILSHPTFDETNQTLTFDVNKLNKDELVKLGQLHFVTLFVDDWSPGEF